MADPAAATHLYTKQCSLSYQAGEEYPACRPEGCRRSSAPVAPDKSAPSRSERRQAVRQHRLPVQIFMIPPPVTMRLHHSHLYPEGAGMTGMTAYGESCRGRGHALASLIDRAAKLAAIPAGASPANRRSPVTVVVITTGRETNPLKAWSKSPRGLGRAGGRATWQAVAVCGADQYVA
jgi:hypothetical protein